MRNSFLILRSFLPFYPTHFVVAISLFLSFRRHFSLSEKLEHEIKVDGRMLCAMFRRKLCLFAWVIFSHCIVSDWNVFRTKSETKKKLSRAIHREVEWKMCICAVRCNKLEFQNETFDLYKVLFVWSLIVSRLRVEVAGQILMTRRDKLLCTSFEFARKRGKHKKSADEMQKCWRALSLT